MPLRLQLKPSSVMVRISDRFAEQSGQSEQIRYTGRYRPFSAVEFCASMSSDLHKLLENVTDRDSFLVFVRGLMEDRSDEARREKWSPSSPYGPGHNGWENVTIEDYLESAIAWAESTVGAERAGEPSWRSFAEFLYAGKIYE